MPKYIAESEKDQVWVNKLADLLESFGEESCEVCAKRKKILKEIKDNNVMCVFTVRSP